MKKILFTLLLVLGISAAADAQVRFLDSSTDAVRKEAIAQDKLVFIDLYATWCGPCKMLSPVIDGLADRYEGKVLVGKVNTDEQPELAIRFGETIKAYQARGLDKSNLVLIPLVLAGYARYLKGIDDNGKAFEISPDPLLAELQAIVAPLEVKEGEQDFSCLKKLYSRADVFGVDLYEVGLGEQIEGMVKELYAGNGAVRKTLHKYVVAR